MGERPDPMVECGFTWTIDNFSSCSDRVGHIVKSPIFSGGADRFQVDWALQLYPNGVEENCKGYVSLYLYLVSCNKAEIDVNFKLSIVNRFNVRCRTKKKIKSKFIGVNDNWGFPSFVRRAELLDKTNGLLVEDKLRIHCIIHIGGFLEYNSLPSIESREVVVPESSLAVDFWQLYLNQKLVDVAVEVNGKEFMVHKAVLAARSPVFASMFETNMTESNMNRVVITDIEPDVFVELLRFMYSDKAENLEKVACGLLACAEKYALERLKVMCEESISANLSVENAADVLLLADLHRAVWLKRQALDFIKAHALEITRTDGWNTLIKYPQLVAEAFKSLAAFIDDTITFG
ncbi:hypothetical protein GE061_004442 [Apolygus lucorum]|uniref:BTB domain-containing protein n=1 Tax=Apolygus lucorum TaxID=248454 RepID=A0A8S9X372_APOLU|nr:hypothetical protein GE061_004442 [Apolygus lucorum]